MRLYDKNQSKTNKYKITIEKDKEKSKKSIF